MDAHERSHTPHGRWVKSTRWSLLKAPEHQTVRQLATLWDVQHVIRRLYRAFPLREELRLLYHLHDPAPAPAHLDAWLAWAARSRLRPFVRLARTLRAHRDGILAAIRLGLSNGRLEHLNSKIPLISHRAFELARSTSRHRGAHKREVASLPRLAAAPSWVTGAPASRVEVGEPAKRP